ncbi:bi-domain-containing oxidoreductase [Lewinella sp. JB7]|uniref:bi-domain-containing oxidoreductase n=1 Tax=Lewinella sp. JB7 TaxID=2962887 RepID=UPI0020C9AF31|nr:bi-domain-containing oxidoreductase [Lewinella sp. JB7]MCP9236771.1 bi-domain-containing oxidoreductase [Lewinella sp. JB7]
MKQLIQNLRSGETILEEVPVPRVGRGQVLIRTRRSLVSLGTERMLVEFGKAGLVAKARQQPEKVKMVLDKIQAEGLLPTLEAVFNKLGQPLPLGYCNAGIVEAVGPDVTRFRAGDRVVSNGPHAEFVTVPQNLVARVPEGVSDEEAAFTVISAIGLQGIRLLQPTLGETVVVFGLGLIGLITAELLLANGCRVIGLDLDEQKLEFARNKGITTFNPSTTDPVAATSHLTDGVGVDGVIITASAKTDAIVSQAARMCRKRGRIILVGVVGLQLNRSEFYEKELSFQVSCSYGPGRYDAEYEEKGQDYPIGFVRWTEQRNFQAVLEAIERGRLDVQSLITERVPLAEYGRIYEHMGQSNSIASILEYPEEVSEARSVVVNPPNKKKATGSTVGIIGAGNFTKMTMLPALDKTGADLSFIAGAGGVNATALAKKHGITRSTTDYRELLDDPQLGCVLIATRHHLHAPMIAEVLGAGKHAFVEKPLAIDEEGLNKVMEAYASSSGGLMVGFNRRFSPHTEKIKAVLDPKAPKNMIATMNAGAIPPEVWVHDMQTGGGRLVGEACHFIDLLVFLSGSLVTEVCTSALGLHPEDNTDNASILLRFANGDQGVINYFANGDKSYSKERLEVYSRGGTIVMDNFRKTKGFGVPGLKKFSTRLDKGHRNQFTRLMEGVKTGDIELIPYAEIINVSRAALAIVESLKTKSWVSVPV